jgi:uncharacterized protein
MQRWILVAAVLALALAAGAVAGARFGSGSAVIDTGERRVTLTVELATTPAQQAQGLMHRRRLAPNAGMAFLFGTPRRGQFWMKNTRIPLSIAFWGANGRILKILHMTPCRADPCPLYDPRVAYVGALEVNRGAFGRWGVTRGDRITVRRRA